MAFFPVAPDRRGLIAIQLPIPMIYYVVFYALFIVSPLVPYRRRGNKWPANTYLAFVMGPYAEMVGFPLTLRLDVQDLGFRMCGAQSRTNGSSGLPFLAGRPELQVASVSLPISRPTVLILGWRSEANS